MPRWRSTILSMTAVAGLMMVSGCGTSESAECLTNDVGEVCAVSSDGLIEFSGSGLTPDSEVLIDHPELTTSSYQVGPDGSFEPGSRGVIVASVGAETAFAFRISAIDAEGQPFDGDLIAIP